MTTSLIVIVVIVCAFATLLWRRRGHVGTAEGSVTQTGAAAGKARATDDLYDKAEYHADTVADLGLPEEHAYNHTTFFMAWLIKNDLTSSWFAAEGGETFAQYRAGTITMNQLYEWWDCCFVSDMLSDRGNAFARSYFAFEKGTYLADYKQHLQGSLESDFHAPYTPENERVIHAVIDRRYREWSATQGHHVTDSDA